MKLCIRYAAIVVAVLFLGSKSMAQQVGDYGSAASGNWSDLSSWVVCQTNGDWSDASAAGSLPTTTDKVYILDGHTITINQNITISDLIVGEGAGGILTFDAVSGRSVTVSGNITVSSGGAFIVFQALTPTGDITSGSNVITNVSSTAGIAALWNISGTGLSGATVSLFDATTITISVAATISGTAVPLSIKPTLTNTLSIGGNLTNNGKFDMSLGSSTTVCNVTFTKAGDQTLNGTGDTTRFRGIALSKTAKANKVISSSSIMVAGTSLFIPTGSTGTWEQTAGTMTVSSSQTTGVNTALNIIGTANWSQYVSSNLTIVGDILVNTSGTVTIGNGSNKFDVATAGASAVLTSGTINVFGKVAFSAGANITLNGANINVDPQDVTSLLVSEYTFRITTGGGTALNWSAGTIKIVDPNVNNATGAVGDFVTTSVLNMSGTAKLVIGNGTSTTSNAYGGFRISSTATQLNMTINSGSVGIVRLSDLNVKTLTYTSSGAITGAFLFKYGASGTLEYNGTSAQTTTDTEFPSLANVPTNLTINNASGVTLHAARTLSGALTLTNGNLTLNGQSLTYGTITGTEGTISESQSLNAPSAVNVGTLGTLITSAADLGSTTVKRGFNVQSGNGNQSILRWYDITPTTNSGLDATLVFPYSEGAELNGIAEANLRLFKSTDNGTTWTLAGGTVDEGANTVTLSGIAAFSRWTLGSVTSPLPVELQSFVAQSRYGKIELKWTTATEVNNRGFEVEKKVNGTWNTLGFVEGYGTSNVPQSYSFVDASAKGTVSYRLKQIDGDGKYTFSAPVEAAVALTAEDFLLSQNYPNPFNPSTTITFAMKNTEHVRVNVYNSLGQAVANLFDGVAQPGELYSLTFNGKSLSSGTYFTVLRSATRNEIKKMSLMK